ncbi:MAG TPA: MFS transporter [Chitinophagaceae bacterium]|nr:MFS transporter [Chitinophagaceae bacterium]
MYSEQTLKTFDTKKQRFNRAWITVALLVVVAALNYLDRTMITTMRSSILQEIPMTEAQFGLLSSVFLWVYGLLSPFAGFVADKFNRSKVIIVSLIVWSGVTWLTAHASTFNELLLTRALMGISEACYVPAALALIADYHGTKTRSLATGIHMAGIMAGQSLGFVGGWIAEEHSWNTSFTILGIFGIVYAVLLVAILRDPAQKINEEASVKKPAVNLKEGVGIMFKDPSFIKVLIYWSLLGVVSWLVMGWLPTYYKEQFSLSQTAAGIYATGYLYPVSLAGVIIGGLIADRWSRKNKRARILLPVLGMLIAAPFIFMATVTSILPVAIVFFMVYAFTRAFTDANMMPILCMIVDERYRATGYGILNMFSTIVGGLALYAGGILRDAQINLSYIYQFAGVTMLICAWILYKVKPRIEG